MKASGHRKELPPVKDFNFVFETRTCGTKRDAYLPASRADGVAVAAAVVAALLSA